MLSSLITIRSVQQPLGIWSGKTAFVLSLSDEDDFEWVPSLFILSVEGSWDLTLVTIYHRNSRENMYLSCCKKFKDASLVIHKRSKAAFFNFKLMDSTNSFYMHLCQRFNSIFELKFNAIPQEHYGECTF